MIGGSGCDRGCDVSDPLSASLYVAGFGTGISSCGNGLAFAAGCWVPNCSVSQASLIETLVSDVAREEMLVVIEVSKKVVSVVVDGDMGINLGDSSMISLLLLRNPHSSWRNHTEEESDTP